MLTTRSRLLSVLRFRSFAPPFFIFCFIQTHLSQQNDFTNTRFAAIFALGDSHDWGRDTTLVCELMRSVDGVLGTRRETGKSVDDLRENATDEEIEPSIPFFVSNPDLEWQR